jgi:hypothetical protein
MCMVPCSGCESKSEGLHCGGGARGCWFEFIKAWFDVGYADIVDTYIALRRMRRLKSDVCIFNLFFKVGKSDEVCRVKKVKGRRVNHRELPSYLQKHNIYS